MHPSLRRALLLSWVILTLLSCAFPPWDICWHRDGALCSEIQRSACCGDEAAPPAQDDSCSDCTDFAATPALRSDAGHVMSGIDDSVTVSIFGPVADALAREIFQSVSISSCASADASPPRSASTRPLRC